MPAYNYFPASYQPYYVQPTQMSVANQTPAGIIWISGLQEAQMYPVAPNNAVALWEQSGKVVYLKQADATGKPSMKVFELVERPQNASEPSSPQGCNYTDYATKEDLSRISGAVKGMDNVLETLRADIEEMKGELYGAKKKTVKKVEDDE